MPSSVKTKKLGKPIARLSTKRTPETLTVNTGCACSMLSSWVELELLNERRLLRLAESCCIQQMSDH